MDPLLEKWSVGITDHFWPFFPKWVQPPPPPPLSPTLHTQTDGYIQTVGDYIKRVVYGPSGDHTLKNPGSKTTSIEHTGKLREEDLEIVMSFLCPEPREKMLLPYCEWPSRAHKFDIVSCHTNSCLAK